MAGGRFLNLEELSFDCSHAGHQTIEFAQEDPLILACFFDEICGRAVADPMKGVCKPNIQEPHIPLQIDELLMQLVLLKHDPISSGAVV